MEVVDHATNYDAKSCILILGAKDQTDGSLNLSEEQNKLLYHAQGGLLTNSIGSNASSSSTTMTTASPWTPAMPSHRKGWGRRNIISARTAWAKLRLMEESENSNSKITLPSAATTTTPSLEKSPLLPAKTSSPNFGNGTSEWYNEDKAEHDEALALISEGAQLYIRRILEGAIGAARQRLNLDGVRLWHRQHAAVAAANAATSAAAAAASLKGGSSAPTPDVAGVGAGITVGTNSGGAAASSLIAATTGVGATGGVGQTLTPPPPVEVPQPPLLLRLGCDVSRQYALTEGNAAKVCQRMEEALMRGGGGDVKNDSSDRSGGTKSKNNNSESSNLANPETLQHATSMADLSRRPNLPSASANADYHAKRRFEVYGGKNSGLPPFGRVPKKVKITPRDVQLCLAEDPSLARFHSKRRLASVFM